MIADDLIHQRESTEETESFLQENIDKFEGDAVFLLRLMLKGERLTAKTVVQKYGKESRRLRDLFITGKCEKEWVLNDNGKRLYVEYFVNVPSQPTKEKLHQAARVVDMIKQAESNLVTVFTLDDEQLIQKPLFE